jgi:hypothetical protein
VAVLHIPAQATKKMEKWLKSNFDFQINMKQEFKIFNVPARKSINV